MKNTNQKFLGKLYTFIPRGVGEPYPLLVKRAENATIFAEDGRHFIDFASGISATNLGHVNKKVIQAIKDQSGKFLHTCFLVAPYKLYGEVAEMLTKITPGKFDKKVFFANSGAEAVENAVKIARYATKRSAVISFSYAFHGRTLLTMSLTSKVRPYKLGFGPFAPEIYHLPYPYMYRRPGSFKNDNDYCDYLLAQIEDDFFKSVVAPTDVAAVIMEPVAGEGGFIVAPDRYMQGLSKICKKYGILLIIDEVQTGFARTGKMFASEWSGIEPDLLCCAKSIASGMPLSAVVGRSAIMDTVEPGGIGGTFGGNPVCLAAAKATLQEMARLKIEKRAVAVGTLIEKTFNEIASVSPIVGEARGRGAMWALEIVTDKKSKKTDSKKTKELVKKMFAQGLLILSTGLLGNVIRALPPLTIPEKDLKKALNIIKKTILN